MRWARGSVLTVLAVPIGVTGLSIGTCAWASEVVIPLAANLGRVGEHSSYAGIFLLPDSLDIKHVSVRWEGVCGEGFVACSGLPDFVSLPTLAFRVPIAELDAYWTGGKRLTAPGPFVETFPLQWSHIVRPEDRVLDPPWHLLAGRELEYAIWTADPGLWAVCHSERNTWAATTSVSLVIEARD